MIFYLRLDLTSPMERSVAPFMCDVLVNLMAQVIGRSWATEAGGYIAKLKTETMNYDTLQSNTYHLNMVMAQSGLTRLQEPTAFFELTLSNHEKRQNQTGDAPVSVL